MPGYAAQPPYGGGGVSVFYSARAIRCLLTWVVRGLEEEAEEEDLLLLMFIHRCRQVLILSEFN